MGEPLSRRAFLRQAAGGMAIIGFNTRHDSWLTAADRPGSLAAGDVETPQFDGQLVTDEAALDAAADDFGHIVHRRPMAVLRPGSVDDIVTLVRYARSHGIKVGARGQGHSTYGQAQVAAGVVVDLAYLNRIHEVNVTDALVDAGVRWIDLLQETLLHGLTPPTLTDYIELSVGGTLSVGGIGGQAFRSGTQTDNVLELQVVTGRGDLVTCASTVQPELFHACRAGLGQCGIIVGARVRLVPAPPLVRVYKARYLDLGTFMADQERLIDDGRFDYVEGSVEVKPGGGWWYVLETAKYYAPDHPPADLIMPADLAYLPGTATTEDQSYFDFANRLAVLVAALKALGWWDLPHPWLDLFIPATSAVAFIANLLLHLDPKDVGDGPILIYPVNRARCRTPLFRVPDERHFFLLALLRFAKDPTDPTRYPTAERVQELIEANRRIYHDSTVVGSKRYPIDSVPMEHADWAQHFDPLWDAFVAAKRYFDPDNILTPGQGIF